MSVAKPLLLCSFLLLACGGHHGRAVRGTVSATEAHVVMIEGGLQAPDIRAAIGRALTAEKFSTEKDEEGQIIANYSRGPRRVKLGVEYDASKITLRYLDGDGMGVLDAQGNLLLDKHYNDLIAHLDNAIHEEMRRPQKEAQAQAQAQSDAAAAAERQARQDQIDAEERQRAYAIAIEREKTRQANATQRAAEARAMAPPVVRVETQPPAPGPDYYWTPGHWGWENGRYAWIAGFWAQTYTAAAPPPPQAENPGVPPSDQYFWVRGQWRWNGQSYAWVSGHWDTVRVGFVFVPPHWENVNGRWAHIEGRWVNR